MKILLVAALLLAPAAAGAQEDDGADGAQVQANEGAPNSAHGFGHATRGFANSARPLRASGAATGAASGAAARQAAPPTAIEQVDDQRTTGDKAQEDGSPIGPSAVEMAAPARLKKPVVRPGAPATAPSPGSSPGSGSSSPGSGGGNAPTTAVPGASKVQWQTFASMYDIPDRALSHRILHFTKTNGYAVGFWTGPAGRGGMCSIGMAPPAPTSPTCEAELWVSEKPGGPAVTGCGPVSGRIINSLNIQYTFGAPPRAPKGFTPCALKPLATYYCDVTVPSGWTSPDTFCNALLGSPIGFPAPGTYPTN